MKLLNMLNVLPTAVEVYAWYYLHFLHVEAI